MTLYGKKMKHCFSGLQAALGFLTVLPLGKNIEWNGQRMLAWFPVAGLVLGVLLALWDTLLGLLAGPALRAVLDVLFLVALTGGLHLDGLADAADGLLGHRGRERALEIMRDSRIGAWGVLALLAVLGIKTSALYDLLTSNAAPWRLALGLTFVPVFGRLAQCVTMRLLPYCRGKEGMAHSFFGSGLPWVPAVLCLLPFLFLLGIIPALACFAVFSCGLGALLLWYRKLLGCITGDMIGAASECCEALLFVALSVVLQP